MTGSETVASLGAALAPRYAIERELGRGGMATVYLAEDRRLQRRVALKVLHHDLAVAVGPDRFLREIHIAARLSHPNILALHDSGEAAGRLFFAMPYVEGESLRQRLAREPQLPVAEAVRIAGQVADALAHAHEHGIVHRDIKPENILLAGDRALVADFGIAKALDAAGGERLTATGLSLGTPAYMSPEQAAGGAVDARSDIYALGCVAYEMLTGTPPFTGSTAQAIMARHAVDPVPPLRTVRHTVPGSVAAAIERALAKVPADRFASVGEFAEAIVATGQPWRPAGHAVRLRLSLMLPVAVAIVLGGIGALTLRRPSPTVVHSASSIAVLPFRGAGDDTALTRLGKDLAIAVSASLDGVGGITTTDRVRVAREAAARQVGSPEAAAALARRLGARSVLMGTMIRDGDRVRVDLDLYDVLDQRPLVNGITVAAHRDSVAALSDSVCWAVLRQVWRRGKPPTPSLAAVTTTSLSALRAFLDGEREVENDDWSGASLAYRSAIAADTTFALAYFRYWVAQYWSGQDPELHFPDSSFRARLPERERLLAQAFSTNDSLALELERYREVTRRYPDYWPAWFLLGDRLHHVGILLGYGWKDAQTALNMAVALNPNVLPIWDHLFRNSIGKDTIESGRALVHIPKSDLDQLLQGVARSGGVIGPSLGSLADSIAKERASGFGKAQQQDRFPSYLLVFNGFPAAQIDFDRRVMRFGANPRTGAAHLWGTAWAWAERGAWDSALVAMHEAVALEPNPLADGGPTAVDEYAMAVLGAWLGHLSPAQATARRQRAGAVVAGLADRQVQKEFIGQLAWLDGILAFSRQDRHALGLARSEGRRSGHPHARIIDVSLAAFARALDGDRQGAGQALASLEWRCANRGDCGGPVTPNMAVHRVAAALWLLESGDTAQAARLLTWTEAKLGGGWDVSFTHAVSPLAYLMRARIEEALGDSRSAADHYDQFLRRYDRPMPAQRHLVADARASLARLAGRMDPMPEP